MKILRCFLVLAALISFAVAADIDVSGKWSGSFNATGQNGEIKETTAVMLLKQSGTDITGTVGPATMHSSLSRRAKSKATRLRWKPITTDTPSASTWCWPTIGFPAM